MVAWKQSQQDCCDKRLKAEETLKSHHSGKAGVSVQYVSFSSYWSPISEHCTCLTAGMAGIEGKGEEVRADLSEQALA